MVYNKSVIVTGTSKNFNINVEVVNHQSETSAFWFTLQDITKVDIGMRIRVENQIGGWFMMELVSK